MAETTLNFILSAQNRMTGQIESVNTSLKQLETSHKTAAAAAEAHSLSFGRLAASMGVGMLAFNAFQNALHSVTGLFTGSIGATEQLGMATLKLQRTFGLTAEQGSGLVAVFDRFGVNSDNAAKSMAIFQKNMEAVNTSSNSTTKLFEKYNIQVNDTSGKLRNMNDVLLQTADRFRNDIPITERAAAAKALFGRAGIDLIPVLIQGSQGIKDLEQHAASLGIVLSQGNVNAIRANMMAQNDLKEAVGGLKIEIGNGLMPILSQLTEGFTTLVAGHGRAILSFVGAALAVVTFGGALFGVIKLIQLFQMTSFLAFVTNPAMLALVAIAALMGVVVYNAMDKMQQKMQSINGTTKDLSNNLTNNVPAAANNTSAAMAKIGDQLQTLQDQIKDANATFAEQMANIVHTHLDKVNSLKDQIAQENDTFNAALTEKTSNFNDSQSQMVQTHQDKVNAINQQIDAEVQKGAQGNYQTLQNLRQSLAQENASYTAQFSKQQDQYNDDVKKTQDAHDKSLKSLQDQLDQENAFLKKHNADVQKYRNADLLDEIDKLKQSHDKQLEQFAKQKESIIKNAQQTTAGIEGAFNQLPGDINSQLNGAMGNTGKTLGTQMANSMRDAIKTSLQDAAAGIVAPVVDFFDHIVRFAKKLPKAVIDGTKGQQVWTDTGQHLNYSGRASGGPVMMGSSYVVGENGPEIFTPNQSGMIVPNGGSPVDGSGNTTAGASVNLTVSVGMYAGLPSEKRAIAVDLYREMVREARAHGVQLPQIGSMSVQ